MTYANSHIHRRHVDKVDKHFRPIESVETVDIVDVSTGWGCQKSGASRLETDLPTSRARAGNQQGGVSPQTVMGWTGWGGIKSLEPLNWKPTGSRNFYAREFREGGYPQ